MQNNLKINPIDQLIDLDTLKNLKSQILNSGVKKLIEIENKDKKKVIENAIVKINISIRELNGKFAYERYNPVQSTKYNLINLKAKKRLPPKIKECVLTSYEGDVFWVYLQPDDHDRISKNELIYRIGVKEVKEIKISFPELSYDDQKKMVDSFKVKGDQLFISKKFKEASEIYLQGFTFFLQVPKKRLKKFSFKKKKDHFLWGIKIIKNYLKSLYKSKNYTEYKEKIRIIEKKYENYPLMNLEFLKIKATFLKILKDEENLNLCIKKICELEKNPDEKKIYLDLKVKRQIRENKKLNEAFLNSLKNAEEEERREKKMKNLKIPFIVNFKK